MACGAYISYQLGAGSDAEATIQVATRPRVDKDVPSASQPEKQRSTSFVLVDPSTSNAKGNGIESRRSIRKHASKACAAQRLATIAAKKASRNVQTKRERQRQQAADRLEAALQKHAQKLATSEATCTSISGPPLPANADPGRHGLGTTKPPRAEYVVRPSHIDDTSSEFDRQRCSISWILAASPSQATRAEDQTHISRPHAKRESYVSPSSIVEVHSGRLDPFSTCPVDVRDDGLLCTLFSFMDTSVFPMMDLRLPAKIDRIAGTRHTHSRELPHFVFSSEPLFWTMALCGATIFSLRNRRQPEAEPITMGYRYMAIRSVNQRLNSLGEDSVYDVGLIYAIASLGLWEREKGSKEVWHSHCQGIRMLSQKLRRASQHHLLAYIISSCHTASSVPIEYNVGDGFRRVRNKNSLNQTLISAIYECGQLEKLSPSPSTTQQIQSTASKLLSYRPSDAVPKTLCGNQARGIEGDRMNLEMHVLLQAAGVSLLSSVGKADVLQYVDMIDFEEMCREAVDLGRSVSREPEYDELLLWCLLTIFALNRHAECLALDIVADIGQKLDMWEWQRLEHSLRLFVYLESHDQVYKDYWAVLQRHTKG